MPAGCRTGRCGGRVSGRPRLPRRALWRAAPPLGITVPVLQLVVALASEQVSVGLAQGLPAERCS